MAAGFFAGILRAEQSGGGDQISYFIAVITISLVPQFLYNLHFNHGFLTFGHATVNATAQGRNSFLCIQGRAISVKYLDRAGSSAYNFQQHQVGIYLGLYTLCAANSSNSHNHFRQLHRRNVRAAAAMVHTQTSATECKEKR